MHRKLAENLCGIVATHTACLKGYVKLSRDTFAKNAKLPSQNIPLLRHLASYDTQLQLYESRTVYSLIVGSCV